MVIVKILNTAMKILDKNGHRSLRVMKLLQFLALEQQIQDGVNLRYYVTGEKVHQYLSY